MEEMQMFVLLFILSLFFGAFLFILVMMCCLRALAFLKNEDTKHLCFKRKQADIRRRRIQRSLLPEVMNRPTNLGYTAAPDENIDQHTICQPYVYEDGRSTGMRMIANLPISIAFTNHSGIPTDSIFTIFPPGSISPRHLLHTNPEVTGGGDLLPPPDYLHAQMSNHNHNIFCDKDFEEEYIPEMEPPPPSYDECMQTTHINSLLYI